MTPERWQKINEVFQSVVELETGERTAFLEKIGAEDKSLRHQVETLLAANDDAGTFIAGNAAKDMGHLLTNRNEPTLSGQNLGHYEIISILGTGGMGKVYLARDSKLNRSVAVKTLPNLFSDQPNFVKRFQTEAKAAATLNHPNVATVYSVEETEDDKFFITMEYVEGKPLNAVFTREGLDLRTFLDWFIALADALSHAHEKGIVHRDIKPSNIMITPSGVPKILDFGLARIEKTEISEEDSTLRLTKTGQVLGTPAYMSPEQAKGENADHRTDIFSLGVVMYEAITGERPFKGDNYASIVSELMTKDPPVVEEVKPDIPYLLSRLIMKCLSKDSRYRYQTMNEVRVILKEIDSALVSGASLSTRPDRRLLSKPKKIPRVFLYVLIGLLSLVSAVAIWQWLQNSGTEEKILTRHSFQSPTGNRTDLLGTKISPDGRNLVIPAYSSEGEVRLYLRSFDKFEAIPIKGTERGTDPFFSSDGKWIVFWEGKKNIKKVPVAGGVPLTICDACSLSHGGDWSDDETIVFSDSSGLFRVSANGGEPERLTTANEDEGEKSHRFPHILPDQKNVIFTINQKGKNKIAILSLETKQVTYLEAAGDGWYPKYVPTGHLVYARGDQLFGVGFDLSSLKVVGKPKIVLNGIYNFLPEVQIADNGTLIYLPAVSEKDNSLVWIDRKGNAKPFLEKKDNYFAPRLSPDGKRAVVLVNKDIWVYETESAKGVRLTFDRKAGFPIWTPDSQSVIYIINDNDEWTVFQKNADGSGNARKVLTTKKTINSYSIHPTENIIAFSSFPNTGKGEILTASLSDGKLETLIESPEVLDMPRFSPDGKWLAYFSIESGDRQIFVRSWGETARRFLVSEKSAIFPVWTKKGNELIFRTPKGVYAAGVQNGTDFQIGEAEFLFKGSYRANFDVTPDGQKFLAVKSEKSLFPEQLNIVSNWTKELKQTLDAAE